MAAGDGLKKHKNLFKRLDGLKVEVGWFESNRYPDKTTTYTVKSGEERSATTPSVPVATVARWNEFGTGTIPARPFMRLSQRTAVRNMTKINAAMTQDVLNKGLDPKIALDKNIGGSFKTIITNSIKNGGWKENSNITIHGTPNGFIKGKGFDKPLIDSSLMLQSITSKVS